MLFNMWEIPDQFFISLHRGEVLHIAGSLAAVFIVLVHDDTVNEVRFRESSKQMKYAVMGNTKQLRVSPQLNEFL